MSAAVAAALQQRLKRALPGANAQDVSNSLWALSRLGWRLEGELAAAAGAAAQRTAPLMGPQAVSNSLWAYGSRGWQLGDAAAAELRQRLVEVLPSSPPQAVANSLAAASRLGWRLDGRLAAAAEAALLRTLPHSTAEGVADALWAHGHARWQLGSPSQAAFADQLVRVLPRASPAQLGDVCKALGRLRWDPGADVVAAAAAAVQRLLEASLQCCTLAGAADAAALGAAAAAAAAARDVPAAAAASVVQPLRNLLWSLAELRLSPPERLTHLTTEWIAVQLGCCDDSQLSAVTQGGTQPAAVHVCDLLYCLARLGAEVDGDLLGAAVQRRVILLAGQCRAAFGGCMCCYGGRRQHSSERGDAFSAGTSTQLTLSHPLPYHAGAWPASIPTRPVTRPGSAASFGPVAPAATRSRQRTLLG